MKKIGISLITIICLLIIQTKVVYADDYTQIGVDKALYNIEGTITELEEYLISITTGGKENYYVSSVYNTEVTLKLHVKYTETGTWLGTGEESELIEWTDGLDYLLADSDVEAGDEWEVWMDIEYVTANRYKVIKNKDNGNVEYVTDDNGNYVYVTDYDFLNDENLTDDDIDLVYYLKVVMAYRGDDFDPEEDGWDGTLMNEAITYVEDKIETAAAVIDFVTKFWHNPPGTLATYFFDLLRAVLGDAPQLMINSIQTLVMDTFTDWTLVYEVDDIPDAANDYLNYDGYVENGTTWTDWHVEVDGEEMASYTGSMNFTRGNTELPVICVDYYNMGVGDINFFDINFLTGDDTHEDGSAWTVLRNVAAALIHATLYVTAAVLIATLIWRGIQIVLHSGDSPKAQAIQREGLNKFVISVAMLIGTIIIMALCIFASQAVFNTSALESAESSKELPIRVNVETAGYSFSTNITGYVRYMTEIENVDRSMEKLSYVVVYIILVWVNVIATIFMIVRVLAIWVLSILGPIIAASYAFGKEIIMPYKTWVSLYVTLALSQLVFAIIYSILLNVAFLD